MPFTQNILSSLKEAAASIVLIANTFIWYFYSFNLLAEFTSQANLADFEKLFVLSINFLSIFVAGVISTLLMDRVRNRKKILLAWILTGIILSFTPMLFDLSNIVSITVISLVFGSYFGAGMPAAMSYFASSTKPENRAKSGGFTLLIIGVSFSALSIIGVSSIPVAVLSLAILRITCLVTLPTLNKEDSIIKQTIPKLTYKSIALNKSFILYFVPWLMFALVNYLAIPVMYKTQGQDFVDTYIILENVLIAVSAVVSGFLADNFGRKRLAIFGFVLLGLGYAILGLSSGSAISLFSWQIYIILDGVAWGIFYTLFIFTLWGDLAVSQNSDKIYVLGVIPYLFSNFLRTLVQSYLQLNIDESMLFSFAAFFLFLAVLPLIYAPETLPEKVMKDRDLKSYVEKAQRKVQKENQKPHKHPSDQLCLQQLQECEIRKLVEQYY